MRVARAHDGERSQALTEFALVVPILLFLMIGIFDLGRLFYIYVTIDNAANEGARTAIHASFAGLSIPLPTDTDVLAAARTRSVMVPTTFSGCPNGPVAGAPPEGAAWLYITSPEGGALAPGGGVGSAGTCGAVSSASGHVPIRVTVLYGFRPVTPLLHELIGVTLRASATYQTEY